MKINLPKLYSQQDPTWRGRTLGSALTIGNAGCLLTCIAMVVSYFGHEETPATLDDKLDNNGGYSGNLFVWGAVPKLYSDIFYKGLVATPTELTLAQMDFIKGQIDKKMPVLLQIDNIPQTSVLDEHWILAVDYDGDDFIIVDPWDGATKRITSWGVKPQTLIYAYACYEGKPVASEEMITYPKVERDWLIGRATTAKEVAVNLNIPDPDNAPTDAYVRVIGGIKSQVTTAQNQADANAAEVKNRQEQVSRLKDQLTDEQKLRQALADKLNAATQSVGSIQTVYEDRIKVLQGQVDQMGKEKGALNATIQSLITEGKKKDAKITELMKSQTTNLTVADVLVLLFNKLKGVKLK